MWHKLEEIVVVEGELVAETGLRIGAGAQTFEPTATDLPVVTLPDGRPFIPGSSLRGPLRAFIERVVRTLEPVESKPYSGRGACNPVEASEWCLDGDTMRRIREELRDKRPADRLLAERVWAESCRVCRVFGSPWLASRVRVADLMPIGEVRTEVRDGVAINRDKETVQNKFDFELVSAGARFALRITAENLSDAEKGMLMIGLRELQRGNLPLGGFKGRGPGRVRLEGMKVWRVSFGDESGEALRRYLIDGEMMRVGDDEIDGWIESFLNEVRRA